VQKRLTTVCFDIRLSRKERDAIQRIVGKKAEVQSEARLYVNVKLDVETQPSRKKSGQVADRKDPDSLGMVEEVPARSAVG
jgi:hypothetical protein